MEQKTLDKLFNIVAPLTIFLLIALVLLKIYLKGGV